MKEIFDFIDSTHINTLDALQLKCMIEDVRSKAIDEFAESLKYELNGNIITDKEKFTYNRKQQEQICHQNITLKRAIKYVDYIAEQLKAGGKNDV